MAIPAYSVLQVKPAKDSVIGQAAFVQFLASLKSSLRAKFLDRFLGTYETISLEIISLNQTTFFVIACPQKLEHLVRSQIASQYPNALISPMVDYLPAWLNHGHAKFAQLVLTGPSFLPINILEEKDVDQISSILGSFSRLNPGQSFIVQICLFSAPKNWQSTIRSYLNPVLKEGEKASPNPQKALFERKLSSQAFGVDIRLVGISSNLHESQNLISQIAASFGTYSLSEGNSFKLKIPKGNSQAKLKKSVLERNVKYAPHNQYLNYEEISALFHIPNVNISNIKNIAWGKTLKGEPPSNLPVDEGLSNEERQQINFFAKTEFKNHMAVFGIKRGNDRRRHVYVLGKSGTGKSTLLAKMAISDIQRGEGMAFVDPHGDTAEKLLDFVPKDRLKDVAYLDPSTTHMSFRLNPLYVKNPAYGEMVASSIVSIFSKLYGNSWGPRLEYILRNTLLSLVHKPDSTLLDIPRILTNKDYREQTLSYVKDAVLINFWHDEYDKYTEKFQSEAIAPILNKVGQFITSPTIRDVISHPKSTVDLEEMMNSGKIVILNLPQGKIGEDNCALLGAMFISQIQIAAMNRANIPEEERKDFFLYVDEFQNFATTSFIKILSEARKYRLNLILANQYTAQLPVEIQDAIFGNAGTIISYVVGAADANRLVNEFGNYYTQDDLVGLAKYQLVIKLTVNGSVSMPFSAYALPVPEELRIGLKQDAIKASEDQYYRVVEPIVNPPPSTTPSGSGSGGRSGGGYSQNKNQPFSNEPPKVKAVGPFKIPTLEELDIERKKGLRPSILGCFLYQGKVLLVHQKIHGNWQMPQGSVDNKQDLIDAFKKVMIREVGEKLTQTTDLISDLPWVDEIEFPPDKQGLKDMKTDTGESILMKGKKYYFLAGKAKTSEVLFNRMEYDQFKWLTCEEAEKIVKESNTGGKLRITLSALESLKTIAQKEDLPLQDPTLEEMDKLRQQGFRPSVVGCFVNSGKIMLGYQKVYNQWILPQGGVNNHETTKDAFFRELSEEVTDDFLKKINPDIKLIYVDKIEFPPDKQGLRDMVTDNGLPVVMKGKYYYFYTTEVKDLNITLGATEFDEIKWLNFDEANKLIKETNTGGRLRMTINLLQVMKEKGFLTSN